MTNNPPTLLCHLRAEEKMLLETMRQLQFGRFEGLLVKGGELILDPWPTTVKGVHFGRSDESPVRSSMGEAHALKEQAASFFSHVRSLESGTIRLLEVRHGLPFAMEIEYAVTRVMR